MLFVPNAKQTPAAQQTLACQVHVRQTWTEAEPNGRHNSLYLPRVAVSPISKEVPRLKTNRQVAKAQIASTAHPA